MTRPSVLPSWATNATFPAGSNDWSNQPTRVQPAGGVAANGFTPAADVAAEYENWLFGMAFDWINYLDGEATGLVRGTITSVSLAIDGAGSAAVTPAASHVVITGTAPALTLSVGAGTGATGSVVGNDTHGIISITTGTSPTGGSGIAICSITCANGSWGAGTNGFTVHLSPLNAATAELSGTSAIFGHQLSATQMGIATCSVALAAATPYSWSYLIIGM